MKENPFDKLHKEYEEWFKINKNIYLSELKIIKAINNNWENALEIGVGSGLFASKLGIKTGIDPSLNMLELAKQKNINAIQGIAENLPFENNTFNTTLMVTSICFIDAPQKAISEAYRVLKKDGTLIIAFIDKESTLGKIYDKNKKNDEFYKYAKFYSVPEIKNMLTSIGFEIEQTLQTLQNNDNSIIEDYEIGFGKGSFIVVKGIKK